MDEDRVKIYYRKRGSKDPWHFTSIGSVGRSVEQSRASLRQSFESVKEGIYEFRVPDPGEEPER